MGQMWKTCWQYCTPWRDGKVTVKSNNTKATGFITYSSRDEPDMYLWIYRNESTLIRHCLLRPFFDYSGVYFCEHRFKIYSLNILYSLFFTLTLLFTVSLRKISTIYSTLKGKHICSCHLLKKLKGRWMFHSRN